MSSDFETSKSFLCVCNNQYLSAAPITFPRGYVVWGGGAWRGKEGTICTDEKSVLNWALSSPDSTPNLNLVSMAHDGVKAACTSPSFPSTNLCWNVGVKSV